MEQNDIQKGWKDMVKCKICNEPVCGKVICCFTCEKFKECDDVCSITDDISSYEECDDAEELAEMVDLNKQVPDVIKAITEICVQKKLIEEQEKLMRQKLLDAMEQYGVKKFENEQVVFTYTAPTVRNGIDSKTLKKDLPDVYAKYTKSTKVSASVKITMK